MSEVLSVTEYLKKWNLPYLQSSWGSVVPSRRLPKLPKLPKITPAGLDHGSTNVVQAPAPDLASSTVNPDRLFVPSGPSGAAPMRGS